MLTIFGYLGAALLIAILAIIMILWAVARRDERARQRLYRPTATRITRRPF